MGKVDRLVAVPCILRSIAFCYVLWLAQMLGACHAGMASAPADPQVCGLVDPKCAVWWIGRELKVRSIKLNQFTEQLQSLVNDANSQKLASFKKSCELAKENEVLFMPQTITYTSGTSVHAPGSETDIH